MDSSGDPRACSRRGIVAALAVPALILLHPGPVEAQAGGAAASQTVTRIPDSCELLTPSDASELLGEEVGDGIRADVAGLPCQYRSASGRVLTVVAYVASGPGLEGTQPALTFEYCGAEVVRRLDDLGVAAAIYRGTRPEEPGCGGPTLWVATGIPFRGKLNPDLVRETEGQFHLTVTVAPAESDDRWGEILEGAARRILQRLQASASDTGGRSPGNRRPALPAAPDPRPAPAHPDRGTMNAGV